MRVDFGVRAFDRTKPISDKAFGINMFEAIGGGSGGGCWGWSRRGVSERRRLVLCVIHLLNASGSRGRAVQGGGVREIGSVLPTSRIALGWPAAGGCRWRRRPQVIENGEDGDIRSMCDRLSLGGQGAAGGIGGTGGPKPGLLI